MKKAGHIKKTGGFRRKVEKYKKGAVTQSHQLSLPSTSSLQQRIDISSSSEEEELTPSRNTPNVNNVLILDENNDELQTNNDSESDDSDDEEVQRDDSKFSFKLNLRQWAVNHGPTTVRRLPVLYHLRRFSFLVFVDKTGRYFTYPPEILALCGICSTEKSPKRKQSTFFLSQSDILW